jgi:hypothetical protein
MRHIVRMSLMLLGIIGLLSCKTSKIYQKDDYSFYQKDFLVDTSLLKTNGIYIQTKIWTNENGGNETIPKVRKIYKFYKGGQANMILANSDLKTNQDYIKVVNARAKGITGPTLFEGYYRSDGKRMVIQSVNTPQRQFIYAYAIVREGGLVIVKTTTVGKGRIKDKFFTDYYKEYFSFIPTGDTTYSEPSW